MYISTGRKDMNSSDSQFLRDLGIAHFSLDDPLSISLPPPPSPEAPTPKPTEEDARWVQNLSVMWEQDPELEFIPPGTPLEYLTRYHRSIRQAVREAA
jgi:hypothetical protein